MALPKYSGSYNCSFTGDQGVGKTCLALTKANKEFPEKNESTIFENFAADVTVGSQRYLLGLFDIASQNCYKPLRAFAYEKSDVFLLCYSAVKRSSFENIKTTWVPEVKRYLNKKKPLILVGLKIDLRPLTEPSACVSAEEGRQLARQIGAVSFLECSALSRVGMNEVFEEVLRLMISSKKKRKAFAVFRCIRNQMVGLKSNTTKAMHTLLGGKSIKSPKKKVGKTER